MHANIKGEAAETNLISKRRWEETRWADYFGSFNHSQIRGTPVEQDSFCLAELIEGQTVINFRALIALMGFLKPGSSGFPLMCWRNPASPFISVFFSLRQTASDLSLGVTCTRKPPGELPHRTGELHMRMVQNVSFLKLMIFAVGFIAFTAWAAPTEAAGPLYRSTYPSKITYKLGSGLGNILFCWVEIPLEINEQIQNTDPFTGTIVGFGRGLWFTARRFVLGVVDVITFPIDIYGNNYQSIQRTEFPFIDHVE